MNTSTADEAVWGDSEYPWTSEQLYGLYHTPLAPESFLAQSTYAQTTAAQDLHHAFEPSPAPEIQMAGNIDYGDAQAIPSLAMGPPTNPRKRKAPTLRESDWQPYKARILELHIEQKRPLREVKEIIELEFDFTAECVLLSLDSIYTLTLA